MYIHLYSENLFVVLFGLVVNTLEILLIYKSNIPLSYCMIMFPSFIPGKVFLARIFMHKMMTFCFKNIQEYVHRGVGNALPGNILKSWMQLLNCCRSVTFLVSAYVFQLKSIWNWMKIPVERIFCVFFFLLILCLNSTCVVY